MRSGLRRLGRVVRLDVALDFLLPTDCTHCGRPLERHHEHGLCGPCWGRLEPVGGAACPDCGLPRVPQAGRADARRRCGRCIARPFGADGVRAAVLYRGPARSLLLRAKTDGRREIFPVLARFLTPVVVGAGWDDSDIVVPVPTSPLRTLRRGFDPGSEMARPLARALGIPLGRGALRRRVWSTGSMKRLGASRRGTALAGAVVATGRGIRGRSVLLIDDVVTTGSTVRACAAALYAAGAIRVRVACWARTPV